MKSQQGRQPQKAYDLAGSGSASLEADVAAYSIIQDTLSASE